MSTTKGKTVGVWMAGEALDALNKAVGTVKDGTWCAEAVVQRLQREGYLKSGDDAEVAAQAFELSKSIGHGPVKTALQELAAKHSEAVGA